MKRTGSPSAHHENLYSQVASQSLTACISQFEKFMTLLGTAKILCYTVQRYGEVKAWKESLSLQRMQTS